MAFEHKPGFFSANKNKFKEDGDNKPTLTGDGMNLDGTIARIAVWFKVDKNGERFASIKIEPPRESQGAERAGAGQEPAPAARSRRDIDDDIPF
jgi:hypothetical protein